MTQDEQKYLENFIDIFAMEGWSQLMQELEVRAQSYHIQNIEDEKQLYKVKGELSVLVNLLGFEGYVRQTLESDTTED